MRIRTILIAAAMATIAPGALAQTPAGSAEIAEIRAMLREQRALIDAQAKQIADLEQRLEGAAGAPSSIEARLKQIEQTMQRVPELPQDVVSAGDFPGSLRVPGTDAAFRIGGLARVTSSHNLGALGSEDSFITSSIPVAGTPEAGKGSRTTYSSRPTRLNFDIRTPTESGRTLRSFVEADFAGGGASLARLRHACIQGGQWLFGQTWSTFSDPEAEPIGIDFEGLNAISLLRQAQIRFTRPIKESWAIALAVENPAPSLTDAEGVNMTPDFVARVRYAPKSLGGFISKVQHIQAAILVRQLRGEVNDTPGRIVATGGFGLNVSGVLIPRWDADDRIRFATNNGYGVGRYITDLGSLGGQDAVYDPVRDALRALPVASAYAGYERQWRPGLLSAFTYGVVNVSNLDIQPDSAMQRTQRTSYNLTWTPWPRLDLVAEFLTGARVNKDGQNGFASQFQFGSTFRF